MKKKIIALLSFIMVFVSIFAISAMISSAEGEDAQTITISYINSQHTTSTDLDKVAHADGKITVAPGEKFTLPTTANSTFVGQEGYVLVWFTENGRTYMAGDEVSFTEDTKLFRCVAKECATAAEVKSAMGSDCMAAILTADIESTDSIGHKYQNQAMLVLNGHTFNITRNNTIMGDQRTGKNIIGKGTVNCYVTDNSYGKYKVFESKSHGWAGDQNRIIVGVDVTLNAPNFKLTDDWDGSYVQGYPWVRIYGKVSVYNLGEIGTANRTPRFEFFEGSELTLGDTYLLKDVLNNKYNVQGFQINISGGKFNLPEEAKSIHYWTNDYKDKDTSGTYETHNLTSANRDKFNITGGSFSVKLPDGLLKNGYECVYNEETEYYDVVYVGCTLEGSNGVHNYKVQEAFLECNATCDEIGVHYYRCMCGSNYVDMVDALGHDYSNVVIEKIATTLENGVKRVTCTNCQDSYTYEYSFDPSEQIITIVVKNEEATKEITATVKDFYNVTISDTTDGYTSSFNGVKEFADPDNAEITYTIADVVEIVIPAGFTHIKTSSLKGATALKKIVLLDGANVTFETKSIDGCTALENITVGDCSVIFNNTTINGNTADIELDLSNANATFKSSAFDGKAIKSLVLGKDKKYDFGENSFRKTKIESLVFPDGSNAIENNGVSLVRFSGGAAFYACPNLKYVYFGSNIIAPNKDGQIWLTNKPFDCAYALELVVLMDITHINEYTFCCAAAGNESKENKEIVENGLVVYHHGSSLSLDKNTFANRRYYGVKLYTTASNITSLLNCVYTIYNGINHAYTEGGIPATCTTPGTSSWSTDCPCGNVYDASYSVYSTLDSTINGTSGSVSVGTVTNALGHNFTYADETIVGKTEANCLKNATVTYKCTRCDVTETKEILDSATGHTLADEWTVLVEATCTIEGLQQKFCVKCGALAMGQAIPAIGHKASGEWVTIVEATCTVGATKVQYCINEGCGIACETETTEPEGHKPSGVWEYEKQATCTTGGVEYQRCNVCRAIIETREVEALGCEFDIADGATLNSIVYANGYGAVGVKNVKCARCDQTTDLEVPAIFTAEGYSISGNGASLLGGYKINTSALQEYNAYKGTKLTYGIIMSNSAYMTVLDGKYTGGKGVMATENNESYTTVKYVISGFSATEQLADLNLVITLYVVDENGMSFVQNDTAYGVAEASVEGKAVNVNAITFGYIAQKTIDTDTDISSEYREILDAIIEVSKTTVTVVPPQDEEEEPAE
ncbi:MAG: hypothetical protein J6B60_04270 [Clostridia bacterium]|nr:hypothetical protein [Clostridia bacterium]